MGANGRERFSTKTSRNIGLFLQRLGQRTRSAGTSTYHGKIEPPSKLIVGLLVLPKVVVCLLLGGLLLRGGDYWLQ